MTHHPFTIPQSRLLLEQYEAHRETCTECPTAKAVRRDGAIYYGECPEALRLGDTYADTVMREADQQVNRWYPPHLFTEQERNAARSHFAWHGQDCHCGA